MEDLNNDVELHDEQNTVTTNCQINNPQTEDGQSFNSTETHINDIITTTSRLVHDMTTIENQINIIKIKGKQENSSINATTRAQAKYILKGSTSKAPITLTYQYNIVDQL
jgi:hypothetical protein